jgi:hypothetical protein
MERGSMLRLLPVGLLLALATVIAIVLAVMALPHRPLAIALGALALALVAGEIVVVVRKARHQEVRELSLDAHGLANELRALILQGKPTDFASEAWSGSVAENYRRRFAVRARSIALRIRPYNFVPKHFLYRLVSVGPQDYTEVWQVAEGLDDLANLLVQRPRERGRNQIDA